MPEHETFADFAGTIFDLFTAVAVHVLSSEHWSEASEGTTSRVGVRSRSSRDSAPYHSSGQTNSRSQLSGQSQRHRNGCVSHFPRHQRVLIGRLAPANNPIEAFFSDTVIDMYCKCSGAPALRCSSHVVRHLNFAHDTGIRPVIH